MSGYPASMLQQNRTKRHAVESSGKPVNVSDFSDEFYADLKKPRLGDSPSPSPKDRSKSFGKPKFTNVRKRAAASRQAALQDKKKAARQSVAEQEATKIRKGLDAIEFAEQYEADYKKANAAILAFNQSQLDLKPFGPFLGEDVDRFPGLLKKYYLTPEQIEILKKGNDASIELHQKIMNGEIGVRGMFGGKTKKHRNKKNKTKRRR
jgi:hypothetical protein